MLTQEEIKKLSRLERLDSPIVSFYLNLRCEAGWKRPLNVVMKDLIKEGREQIEKLVLAKDQKEHLYEDLRSIENYLKDFKRSKEESLAIFSQSKNGLFYAYPLYASLANNISVDFDIHIKPLVWLMEASRRSCVVVISQKKARVFHYFMGLMEPGMEILDAIPKKVKSGGYLGYDERHVERHAEEELQRHFKHVADELFNFFKKHQFNNLILGGEKKVLADFEKELHSYMSSRIAGRFYLSAEANPSEIQSAVREIEANNRAAADKELAHQLEVAAFKQGSGVAGLEGTLEAISRGHVHRLVIHENLSQPGMECYDCNLLRPDGYECPNCSKPLVPVKDIINQALEHAIQQKAEVTMISPDIPLMDGIGAFLRFRVAITRGEARDVKEMKLR